MARSRSRPRCQHNHPAKHAKLEVDRSGKVLLTGSERHASNHIVRLRIPIAYGLRCAAREPSVRFGSGMAASRIFRNITLLEWGFCLVFGISCNNEGDQMRVPGVVAGSQKLAVESDQLTAATEQKGDVSKPPAARYNPLRDVASVFEATVAKTWDAYDERLGPRRYVALTEITVHIGNRPKQSIFSQFGGQLPNGSFVGVNHLCDFEDGFRYLLFVGKQASKFSAVWGQLAFRLEKVGNKTIVLGPDGMAVSRFHPGGVEYEQRVLIHPWSEMAVDVPRPSRTLLHGITENTPEVKRAISVDDFVRAAIDATVEVSEALGAEVDLQPDPTVRWDVTETGAPVEG